ncbi:hypothetical protein FM107_15145 [Sphingobacterium sp. JB170]|nr:hypothetical protein FM107_15145 [Sphingobacterium sp. JB170]
MHRVTSIEKKKETNPNTRAIEGKLLHPKEVIFLCHTAS